MRIRILAIGTKMPDWVNIAYADYAKRLPRDLIVELIELPMAQRTKNTDIQKAIEKEAEILSAQFQKNEQIIALDVKGKSCTTEELANQLAQWKMSGDNYSLLIGGPDGLSPSLLNSAQIRWSLSPLTLPHPLVRVLLIEQLYRASSILLNHPYHK